MSGFSTATHDMIRDRENRRCARCCKPGSQAHHRRPRGAGGSRQPGTNRASNGLWLCLTCHGWIESHRTESFDCGWLVASYDDPAAVAVLRHGVRCWLDDFGGVNYAGGEKERDCDDE